MCTWQDVMYTIHTFNNNNTNNQHSTTRTWKQGGACAQLCQHTRKAPHVDGPTIGQSQDDLWCPVKAALNVGIHGFPFITATPKINKLLLLLLL